MNATQTAPQIEIQKIYVKDASLEAPHSPQIFTEQGEAETQVQVGSASTSIAEDIYESVLTLTVKVTVGDKTAYLVEVQQAGLFRVHGFPAEQLGPLLGIFCPTTLFPFAREAIASLISKGGFPPLLLNPMNFEAIYRQHQQEQPSGNIKH